MPLPCFRPTKRPGVVDRNAPQPEELLQEELQQTKASNVALQLQLNAKEAALHALQVKCDAQQLELQSLPAAKAQVASATQEAAALREELAARDDALAKVRRAEQAACDEANKAAYLRARLEEAEAKVQRAQQLALAAEEREAQAQARHERQLQELHEEHQRVLAAGAEQVQGIAHAVEDLAEQASNLHVQGLRAADELARLRVEASSLPTFSWAELGPEIGPDLGGGTFGRVTLHQLGDVRVAVKQPRDSEDPERQDANVAVLWQEVAAGVQCGAHDAIARVLGRTQLPDGRLAMVAEVAENNLRMRMKRRDYTSQQAVEWVRNILAGLAHMHSQGVAHHDVKAENVLLFAGHAKLADLGTAGPLAQIRSQAKRGTIINNHPLSLVDAVSCGSRDDAFAVCIILYDLLSVVSAHLRRANQLWERLREPGFAQELCQRCQSHEVHLPSANSKHWTPEEMNAAAVVAHAAGWVGVPPLLPCVRMGAVPAVIGQALDRALRVDPGDPPTVAGLQAAVESALHEMQLEPAAPDNSS